MVQNIRDIQMMSLNFYNHDGSCPTTNGIDSFSKNGETFKSDDIVVVGGHIGNIEIVNVEQNACGLGLSYVYALCMKNPYNWCMYSGHRCMMDDIRHATAEEIRKYKISAGLTCDAAEAADNAHKEQRIWGC